MTEDELADYIQSKWNCTMRHLPEMHPIDFYAERKGQLVAWVEVKTRNFPSTNYPDAMLDQIKWAACTWTEIAHGQPCWIFTGYTDGAVYGIRPATYDKPLRTRMGAPSTESVSYNAGQTRPVVYIPMEDQTFFGTVPTWDEVNW